MSAYVEKGSFVDDASKCVGELRVMGKSRIVASFVSGSPADMTLVCDGSLVDSSHLENSDINHSTITRCFLKGAEVWDSTLTSVCSGRTPWAFFNNAVVNGNREWMHFDSPEIGFPSATIHRTAEGTSISYMRRSYPTVDDMIERCAINPKNKKSAQVIAELRAFERRFR